MSWQPSLPVFCGVFNPAQPVQPPRHNMKCCTQLLPNDLVLLEEKPCIVKKVRVQRSGKHGYRRVHLDVMDCYSSIEFATVLRYTTVEVLNPVHVDRPIIEYDPDTGFAAIITGEGETEARIQVDHKILDQLKNGRQVYITCERRAGVFRVLGFRTEEDNQPIFPTSVY
eukprot:m.274171 g.274171  ORF g.274171 m.274171 type:complete len:169 (-) comp67635_c0_seq1:13-519(-)